MLETITHEWIPHKKTTDALKKAGYSVKQLNTIRRAFIGRYLNKQLTQASTDYSGMVKSSSSGHDIKAKEDNTLKVIAEKRSHKSENSTERAVEVKKTDGVMTQAEAIAWYEEQKIKTS